MLQMWTIRPVYSKLFIFIYLKCLFLWLRHILRNWFAESCADNFPALPTLQCCTCFGINLPFLGNILVKKLYRKESIRLCHLSPSSEKNVFCVILKEQNHVKTIKEEQLACFCFDRFRAFFRRVQSRTALSITELLITVLFVKALNQSWVTISLVYT